MEMLERCPGCSVTREVEAKKAETGPTFVSSSRKSRPCAHCGYDGPFLAGEADSAPARDSLPSFAGARAKLATATQDLFRLSGSHSLPSSGSHSIPVEASVSEPPPKASNAPSSTPASSARKPEASIMFSLEALMKANQAPPKAEAGHDDASSQLWNMHSAEPLFGTAADEALLTTPLKMEPAQSMDSMTLPSETPNARRWWPIALAATAGLALAAGGIWVFGSGGASVSQSTPASEQAALEAQPPVEPPPVLPAPGEPATAEASPAAAPVGSSVPAAGPVGDDPGQAAAATDPAGTAPVAAATPIPPAAPAEAAKEKEKEKDKPSSTRKPPARAAAPRATAPVAAKAATPFDKAAAKNALNGAASQAASCGAGGAPGKGKIQVTFAPSGKVSDAQLVEGPFAGTTAGKCALRHFRAAKVPAFSGSSVTVAKSFKVD